MRKRKVWKYSPILELWYLLPIMDKRTFRYISMLSQNSRGIPLVAYVNFYFAYLFTCSALIQTRFPQTWDFKTVIIFILFELSSGKWKTQKSFVYLSLKLFVLVWYWVLGISWLLMYDCFYFLCSSIGLWSS